jgi:hypothetical protein
VYEPCEGDVDAFHETISIFVKLVEPVFVLRGGRIIVNLVRNVDEDEDGNAELIELMSADVAMGSVQDGNIELVELTLIDVANVEFEPNPAEIELGSDTTCETKVLGVCWLDSALIEDMNGLVLTVELTLLEVEVSVKPEWATKVKGVLIE